VPQNGRGRFSNLNTKPDTDSQSYLNIQYNSQGFQKKIKLEVMNNPEKSIPGDTVTREHLPGVMETGVSPETLSWKRI
jgi:hypothetical protein